jgi:hypothetical protein
MHRSSVPTVLSNVDGTPTENQRRHSSGHCGGQGAWQLRSNDMTLRSMLGLLMCLVPVRKSREHPHSQELNSAAGFQPSAAEHPFTIVGRLSHSLQLYNPVVCSFFTTHYRATAALTARVAYGTYSVLANGYNTQNYSNTCVGGTAQPCAHQHRTSFQSGSNYTSGLVSLWHSIDCQLHTLQITQHVPPSHSAPCGLWAVHKDVFLSDLHITRRPSLIYLHRLAKVTCTE